MQKEMFLSVRTCRKCEETLSIDEFSRMSSRTEKRRGTCKPCERRKIDSNPKSYDLCKCGEAKRKIAKHCVECHMSAFVIDGLKTCTGCKEAKTIDQFGWRKAANGMKLRSRCRKCSTSEARQIRSSTPIEVRKARRKIQAEREKLIPYFKKRISGIRMFCRKRGWSAATADRIVQQFNATKCCEICKKETKLVIDHCHERNVFRGLLCNRCNTAIGMLRDNPAIIRSAAKYILKAEKTLGQIFD